ncbi:hypothetical protein CPB85DRAFT_1435070 [Mucidula mucida]|nr:hypothetical protein CPB85DRAFT_1435070 [Mucidula mucida]
MGVEVFVNHSTETNIQGTVSVIERFSEVYNNSPLAKRHELQLLFCVWISKLRGTYGDHANNVKKGNRIFKEMNDSKRDLLLGVVQLQLLPSEVLLQLLWKSKEGLVEKAGGLNAWEVLSEAERSASEACVLDDVARELGAQQYAAMSPEEQKMRFGP